MIHTPRITGEVVVPLAVTLSTLAWVSSPPRGSVRQRHAPNLDPSTRRQCHSAPPAAR